MKVIALLRMLVFDGVEKELVITDSKLKDKIELFEAYRRQLVFKEKEGLEGGILKLDDEFRYCYIEYPPGTLAPSYPDFIPVENYLDAEIEDDLLKTNSSLIIAALLYTLSEEGTCFSEDFRMQFASKLKSNQELEGDVAG